MKLKRWLDGKGKSLTNFLVNSHVWPFSLRLLTQVISDSMSEEVGQDNVVQVETGGDTNLVATGKMWI